MRGGEIRRFEGKRIKPSAAGGEAAPRRLNNRELTAASKLCENSLNSVSVSPSDMSEWKQLSSTLTIAWVAHALLMTCEHTTKQPVKPQLQGWSATICGSVVAMVTRASLRVYAVASEVKQRREQVLGVSCRGDGNQPV